MKARILAVIQARMGSARLPGKMLRPIVAGKGALELMLERVRTAETLDRVVVATTTATADDPLVELCARLGTDCFRGSEADVLDRYYEAARVYGPVDAVVRLTGDCPLHDHTVIDTVVRCFLSVGSDYVSNIAPPTYPDGLDVEVFSMAVLEQARVGARLPSEREHVTLYIRNHPELFSHVNVRASENWAGLRWTLDEEEDFIFLKKVYEHFYCRPELFGMSEIIAYLEAHPEVAQLNSSIGRNEGLAKSLAEDSRVL